MAEGPRLSCTVRCLFEADMAPARAALAGSDVVRFDHTCQVTKKRRQVVLVSEGKAADLAKGVEGVPDALCARLCAALLETDLCQCDLSTLSGVAEPEALAALERLDRERVLKNVNVLGMRYYTLPEGQVREGLEQAVGGKAREASG